LLRVGHDHLAYDRKPVRGHEHVLGPAEADALRAELARSLGVFGRVRVRSHLEAPHRVGPAEDRLEVVVQLRRDERDLAAEAAVGSIIGCRSWSSCAGSIRATASSFEIRRSSTMSTAHLSAAAAVRFALRVWSR